LIKADFVGFADWRFYKISGTTLIGGIFNIENLMKESTENIE